MKSSHQAPKRHREASATPTNPARTSRPKDADSLPHFSELVIGDFTAGCYEEWNAAAMARPLALQIVLHRRALLALYRELTEREPDSRDAAELGVTILLARVVMQRAVSPLATEAGEAFTLPLPGVAAFRLWKLDEVGLQFAHTLYDHAAAIYDDVLPGLPAAERAELAEALTLATEIATRHEVPQFNPAAVKSYSLAALNAALAMVAA